MIKCYNTGYDYPHWKNLLIIFRFSIYSALVILGYVSGSIEDSYEVALKQFHGIDHLFGAVTIYDETEWNVC